MKKLIHVSTIVAAALFVDCAAHAKETPTHERGWIGGRYRCAKAHATVANWLAGAEHLIYSFPPELEHTQKSGIVAIEIGTNSPAYRAGLRPGDLILELNHQAVTSLPVFWSAVRAARPGAALSIKAYREGQTMECEATVGREKYHHRGTLMIGLPGFWDWLHPVPTRERPVFSLIAVGWEGETGSPVEFDSVKERYKHDCHPKDKQEGDDEDWRCWLAVVQVSKGETIIEQAPVGR